MYYATSRFEQGCTSSFGTMKYGLIQPCSKKESCLWRDQQTTCNVFDIGYPCEFSSISLL